MKRVAILFLILVPVLLHQNVSGAELNIRNVTVYIQGAEVKATSRLQLQKGHNEIVFKGLSPHIDPATIQIAGGDFTVLSIMRSLDSVENDKQYADSLAIFESRIAKIEMQLRAQRSLLNILGKEEQILLANQKITGEGGVPAADMRSNLEFFFRRFAEIENGRLETNERINQLNKDLEGEKRLMSGLVKPAKKTTSTITFLLQSETARVVPVEIRFLVNHVSWFPTYDIFARNGSVEISYKANIIQQTGSDWNNVGLTVSSASPSKGQAPPQLIPYRLNFGGPQAPASPAVPASDYGISSVRGTVTDAGDGGRLPGVTIRVKGTTIGTVTDINGDYTLNLPHDARELMFSFIGMKPVELPITSSTINVRMDSDMVALDEVVVIGYGVQGALQGRAPGIQVRERTPAPAPRPQAPPSVQLGYQTSFSYRVDVPYNLNSDARPTQVAINSISVPGIMRYKAVPRIESAAFLTALIPDWEQYNLLDGEANLYLDNQFMGRNVLQTRSFDDTLSLSMGRDENIIIERKRQRDYEQRRVFSNRIREERVWQTAIRNNKNEKITIELSDLVPVSQNSDIKVDVLDVSGGQLDKDTGILTWLLEVEPGQTRQIIVHYSVEYPRGRNVFID